jgi:hypothetical protein
MNWMDSLVAELDLLIEQRDVARADADRLADDLRNAEHNGFDSGSGALAAHDALAAKR